MKHKSEVIAAYQDALELARSADHRSRGREIAGSGYSFYHRIVDDPLQDDIE